MTIETLSDYANGREALRNAYRRVSDVLTEAEGTVDEETATALQRQQDALSDHLGRLEAGRFKVGVVGQMNAGKSTLLNALLFGREVMSASATPHTAKLTEVRAGDPPRATVHFFDAEEWERVLGSGDGQVSGPARNARTTDEDGASLIGRSLTLELGRLDHVDEVLRQYVAVADPGEPTFAPVVRDIEIAFPLPDWAADTVWLDTPGTNDPVEARSKVTTDKLGDLDAVLVVLYANQALNRHELRLLADDLLPTGLPSLYVVVNKVDALTEPSALEDVKAYVKSALAEYGSGLPKRLREVLRDAPIHAVSGMAALVARSGGAVRDGAFYVDQLADVYGANADLEAKSGLPRLEAELGQFLASQKGATLLEAAAERAANVAEEASERMASFAARMLSQARDLSLSRDDLEREVEEIEAEARALDRDREKLLDQADTVTERQMRDLSDDIQREIGEYVKRFQRMADERIEGVILAGRARAEIRRDLVFAMTDATDHIRSRLAAHLRDFEAEMKEVFLDRTGRVSSAAERAFAKLRWDVRDLDLPKTIELTLPWIIRRKQALIQAFTEGFVRWERELRDAIYGFETATKGRTTEAIREATERVLAELNQTADDKKAAVRRKKEGLEDVAARQDALVALNKRAAALARRLVEERDRVVALAPPTPIEA